MPLDAVSKAPVTSRTASGGFETQDGTLYVSKPFRSSTSKKLRALITFAPRNSHFDTNNESSGNNEFRGFFSLFWISIFIFMVRTYINSYESNGAPLNFRFATLLSKDAITLALSDAALVGSTIICVPFAKAISKGWIRYYWTGVFIQHTIQTFILFTAVTWTFNRQWPWVQSGFLTLHSLVMIMKMHSYMSVNGYLQYITEQSQVILDQLRQATDHVGGWEKALADAIARRTEADNATSVTCSDSDASISSPVGTPPVPIGMQGSYVDANAAAVIRRRLVAVTAENVKQKTTAEVIPSAFDPHPLIDHPNEYISDLAKEYTELQEELRSPGPEYIVWPNNITFKNFAVYQLIPTLVYELEYPRTDKIRPLYIFEKTTATFGTFVLLYSVTETFILPRTETTGSFFRSLLDLSLPFMLAYLLLFYIIFECICNAFAELSYFADRRFYDDWVYQILCRSLLYRWNSTSWDEFSRKWNKPVHMFLLRHVYASTMASYKLSRTSAMFLTFFLSACVHELVMVIVTQKIRMYLFLLQLIQIPLIAMSRMPIIKQNQMLGNVVFWLGLYAGFPLLCVAYVAY
ncbi:MBOAT, membrane-bound O-acyltransferase family-domain-containing protein [Desarmillaria tabescens]|uniref:O-acyltransferase n=1 Tax=Armillaria tabescens TaxID=1929756 RepID=A0AA39NJY2_ARMTA|nr:MBOAT, membrane-bound O-acyltransferase family-domain-containing protein [Desarmillaria tabescens]KAK0466990.1 MBOAT, membrane-bound O-acyltransferase family-domain-containing protein [Desarmillaria tabescens]